MSSNGAGPKAESKFKRFFRELFCDHIYKIEKEVPLSEHFKFIEDIKLAGTILKVALYQKCLRCGKERIETIRRPKNS
ncbi:hypothetical protein KAR91_08680 [Candidatus Pacearchaeota archaeon]|nr:hypothetical protein [Candidatus Pacearchaeota archaeon]